MTADASHMNVGTAEWIEENEREFGERTVAYINMAGVLSNGEGKYLYLWGPNAIINISAVRTKDSLPMFSFKPDFKLRGNDYLTRLIYSVHRHNVQCPVTCLCMYTRLMTNPLSHFR